MKFDLLQSGEGNCPTTQWHVVYDPRTGIENMSHDTFTFLLLFLVFISALIFIITDGIPYVNSLRDAFVICAIFYLLKNLFPCRTTSGNCKYTEYFAFSNIKYDHMTF